MKSIVRAFLVLASCATPLTAWAQGQTRCGFTSDRFSSDSTPAGMVTFLGGNVKIRCPARSITLVGDSAERYPDRDVMIGHVVYDEPRLHITSDFLNRFAVDDRVLAVGNVNAKLPSGSSLVGPIAEYRRAAPRIRPLNQLLARSRPTVTIVQKDSAGRPVPPTTIVGETIFMDGDSLIYGSGRVVISRTDVTATADSVFMDQTKDITHLIREPVLKGKRTDRSYTLTGNLIDLYSRNKKLQRILSRGNAKVVSDSMTLASDTVDLRVRNDLLDRAYAWGAKSRAHLESPTQNLVADSIDVTMPGQRIQTMRAFNRAVAENTPDTTRFRVEPRGEKDWLRGDTIVAHFDTSKAADTAKKGPDVKRLVASGHAKSFYHLSPSDSTQRRPALNAVTARIIAIDFDKSRVATVTAFDSVSGIYIEPRDSTAGRRTVAGRGSSPAPNQPRPAPPGSIIPLPPKRP
jgi:hypothetical protein